jgi:hypothetical protein
MQWRIESLFFLSVGRPFKSILHLEIEKRLSFFVRIPLSTIYRVTWFNGGQSFHPAVRQPRIILIKISRYVQHLWIQKGFTIYILHHWVCFYINTIVVIITFLSLGDNAVLWCAELSTFWNNRLYLQNKLTTARPIPNIYSFWPR